jgi:hypothetical protein
MGWLHQCAYSRSNAGPHTILAISPRRPDRNVATLPKSPQLQRICVALPVGLTFGCLCGSAPLECICPGAQVWSNSSSLAKS